MPRTSIVFLALCPLWAFPAGVAVSLVTAPPARLPAELLAAYATAPADYPAGPHDARPDADAPFRWHSYHGAAVRRFDDARMVVVSDPYNPLEGEGAGVEHGSSVRIEFVGEHATEGRQSLRATFLVDAVRAGKAVVLVHGIGGEEIDRYRHRRASAYWSHYRRAKLDVFNPSARPVRVTVCGGSF